MHGTDELHLHSCRWFDKIKNLRLELGIRRLEDSMMMIGNEGIADSVECSECYGERQEAVHRIVWLAAAPIKDGIVALPAEECSR